MVDDTVLLRLGDQLLVDGPVLESEGLQVDESLLTGEADPVARAVGEQVLSGSFVVAGSGAMRAQRVGNASYRVPTAGTAGDAPEQRGIDQRTETDRVHRDAGGLGAGGPGGVAGALAVGAGDPVLMPGAAAGSATTPGSGHELP